MGILGDGLFLTRGGGSLDQYLRQRANTLVSDVVSRLPAKSFSEKSDQDLASEVAEALRMQPLSLDLDAAAKNVSETQVVVPNLFGGSARVSGLRLTKTIPFSGSSDLWRLCPNQYDSMPPRGEISGNTVTVGMEVRHEEGESGAQYINSTIADIQRYVGWQAAQIAVFNETIMPMAIQAIAQRRQLLNAANSLKDRF